MQLVSALRTKLVRDLWRLGAQFLAIALVIACGVGVYVGMRATMHALEQARVVYYANERFAHVFAQAVRVPERVAVRLAEIDGVQAVQTRIVSDVTVDVPGLVEAATARLVSIPDRGRPQVNDVRLRSGRWPGPGHPTEVLVSEPFAEAHDLAPGDDLRALLNGRYEELRIVGTALSPEFTYAAGPGQLVPDDRLFGVAWVRRSSLEPAFDLDGAFNDVALRLAYGADPAAAIAAVDRVLDRYGGTGAIPRRDQVSAFFLENELVQLATFAFVLPLLFLLVAAFLLNIVLGRVVAGQRAEIATLKAFGYRDREVGLYYIQLAGLVLAIGIGLGLWLGAWLASAMTRNYGDYYRLPDLAFVLPSRAIAEAVVLTAVGAGSGTLAAIRRTIRLAPAEAMRPEAPPTYRATVVERLGLERLLPPAARIVLRELERKPLRAALSILGIALATGLTIANSFTLDSMRHMLNVQFGLIQREDLQLTLYEPRATSALHDLEHLPGVLYAEPHRAVPVRMRAGTAVENTAIIGRPRAARLTTLMDADLRKVELPEDGLVLSTRIAANLGLEVGDRVRVEVLEGERREVLMPVSRLVQTFVGNTAEMDLAALCRLLGETESLNGASCLVADGSLEALHDTVKRTPIVAGVSSRDSILRNVREILDESIGVFLLVAVSFSLVMSFGVLYNSVRITLSERARDLASLRVLGFRRREVGAILLGELALLVLVALPIGLLLGYLLAGALAASPGFNNDQFRLPFVVTSWSYGLAVGTVLTAGLVSAWSARRRLDKIDIVEVLKTRD